MGTRVRLALGALALLAGASACTLAPVPPTEPAQPTAPAPAPKPPSTKPPSAKPPSPPSGQVTAASRSASIYYRRVEDSLVAQGYLREERSASDARYSAADLARNFERVALFNEYVERGGRFVPLQSAATLRRWSAPVRVALHFGASASEEMRSADSAFVKNYIRRLSAATRHPISVVSNPKDANYHVFVVSLDEQQALGQRLQAMNLGLSKTTIHDIATQGRLTYCFVYASSTVDQPSIYKLAVAVIRTEHPDLMRRSCYHEELAQGLGLANDSPEARPSIFNDDEEFAFLTTHDEQLLRMLYDKRLQPGMTPDLARPIVQEIAGQVAGGSI